MTPAGLMWFMLIIFWSPSEKTPVVVQHDTFKTDEACMDQAHLLTKEWESNTNGGSTSFMCIAAFPAPPT